MQAAATILFGAIVGFFFGLTGSGGSTLAVPLLVYGLGLAPHRAVCTSMISVGAMAALRACQQLRTGGVDARAGWLVALVGLFGAPGGAWMGTWLSEKELLLVFAAIVTVAAIRLWIHGNKRPIDTGAGPLQSGGTGVLKLLAAGLITGMLAGLVGIGGGFVIVPALVLFSGLAIHRAIATSMFSIAVISAAAMGAHFLAGHRPPLDSVGLFTVGGFLGLVPGAQLATWLSSQRLQQVFAMILICLAAFITLRSGGAF